MKLKCINTKGAINITAGKEYNCGKASHSNYWKLKNDNNELKCYRKELFETA